MACWMTCKYLKNSTKYYIWSKIPCLKIWYDVLYIKRVCMCEYDMKFLIVYACGCACTYVEWHKQSMHMYIYIFNIYIYKSKMLSVEYNGTKTNNMPNRSKSKQVCCDQIIQLQNMEIGSTFSVQRKAFSAPVYWFPGLNGSFVLSYQATKLPDWGLGWKHQPGNLPSNSETNFGGKETPGKLT